MLIDVWSMMYMSGVYDVIYLPEFLSGFIACPPVKTGKRSNYRSRQILRLRGLTKFGYKPRNYKTGTIVCNTQSVVTIKPIANVNVT